jgi:hypothetical protein
MEAPQRIAKQRWHDSDLLQEREKGNLSHHFSGMAEAVKNQIKIPMTVAAHPMPIYLI